MAENDSQQSPSTLTHQQPAIMAMPTNIPLPAKLEVTGNLATNWKVFIRAWKNYEIAARLKDPSKPNENKLLRTATFLTCLESDALDIYEGLKFDNDMDKDDIDIVITKFEEYCVGQRNETFERYNFNMRVQQEGETVDAYVTALKTLAKTCNFGQLQDNLLRDRIVIGIKDNATRKKLLNMPKLTLKECIDMCRTHESTSLQIKTMTQQEVSAVSTRPSSSKHYSANKQKKSAHADKGKEINCIFCGKKHAKDRNQCPAWGKKCSTCHKPNHFSTVCKSRNKQKKQSSYVRIVDQDTSDQDDYVATLEEIDIVIHKSNPNKVFVTLSVNDKEEHFQLDTGATVNVMSDITLSKLCGNADQLESCNTTLLMYNKSKVKPIGRKKMRVLNPKNNNMYTVEFIIVKGQCKSILGLKTCEELELLTVNRQNISLVTSQSTNTQGLTEQDVVNSYSDVFKGEGKLEGQLHLELDESVQPVQLPPRRVPLAVKDKLKAELERLSNMEIITKVDDPTDWISSLVVTTKRNGKVRLCIDPKPLNNALKRNHYPLPTIEDVLPLLSDAKLFTVLDARNGFWHVQLDTDSSYLTTFSTPWGRYRWLRMPFGITSAPEEFQRRMDITLEGLDGTKAIADDILVFGTGSTQEEAEKSHDERLTAVLERCRQKGVRLNKDKMQFKQQKAAYMGHVITSDGLQADPDKIKAILNMPIPTDKEAVRRLLGMTNYVQRFAPGLANSTKPLRDLLKKESVFVWDQSHDKAFNEVKSILTKAPVLKYFSQEKKSVLQCDASKDGLGACLMQDGHPIAYASRALTPTEIHYAQIEKELLSVVFGVEKFSEFLYGRHFVVETDHKPLESIVRKSLLSSPKRLQRMLLRLQKYDLEVVYKRGVEMYMADTLSRAYVKNKTTQKHEVQDVMNIDRSRTEQEAEEIDMVSYLPLRDTTIQEIQKHTETDPDLQALATIIKDGWPESKNKVKPQLHCYYPFREELTIQNGVIFKGERVVIPAALRSTMISKLHSSHLGLQGSLRRAREAFYWPHMNEQVTELMSKCDVCNSYKTEQQKEPLICHESPTRPWESIAADLFVFHGKDYLVTTDRYSNFFEVDRLYSKSSSEVITKMKAHIARYGLPNKLMSDNGPNFTSREFKLFTDNYNIEHTTSSPTYAQSNGKAENSVKTVKKIMQKALDAHADPYLAFLDFRNTPTEGYTTSPAQRMLNRRTRTLLPMSNRLLKPEIPTGVYKSQKANQAKQAFYYDKTAKDLKPLSDGDVVRVKPQDTDKKFIKAKVEKQVDIRSYRVKTEDGREFRRNRKDLHKTPEDYNTYGNILPDAPLIQQKQPQTTLPTTKQAPTTTTTSTNEPTMTRAGRVVRKPSHLKDYVTS